MNHSETHAASARTTTPVRTNARSRRLADAMARLGANCVWCGSKVETDLTRATTEHLVPRIKGGPSWPENELPACPRCNGQRGHQSPAEWIDMCEERGWQPNVDAIIAALESLQGAIQVRGGQRKARPYVASQLRRLRKRRAGKPTS